MKNRKTSYPMGRRDWLQVGGVSTFGLTLHGLLRSTLASDSISPEDKTFGRAKSCIVLFLMGGPPQHETWDPKPDAPDNIRGGLKTISTSQPGFQVGELMPKTAAMVNDLAVIRSMSTDDNAHSASGYWMLTGVPHTPKNRETDGKGGAPNDWPCLGGQVRHLLGDRGRLPAAITLPENIWNTGKINWSGQTAGWLGANADPWLIMCDPNAAEFEISELALGEGVTPIRMRHRGDLLSQFNQSMDHLLRSNVVSRMNRYQQRAMDMLSSKEARRAFAIEQEDDLLRDSYGRNRFGQSVLLARRMVESGVRLVQVNWTRWEHDTSAAPAWDNHAGNEARLKKDLMPQMDAAYSTLINDLKQRGLLEDTLVVWMGEFGRTPKINGRAGRDHWGHVYPVALAGGGVQSGVLLGSSDNIGGFPTSYRREPQDLHATILHLLGIAPQTEIHTPEGRPSVVSRGEVISEVLL